MRNPRFAEFEFDFFYYINIVLLIFLSGYTCKLTLLPWKADGISMAHHINYQDF